MIVRADLHIHSCQDPLDNLPQSIPEIVARAAARGLHCLAITNHRTFTWDADEAAAARRRGVLLIPAIEACIENADVLIYNADARAAAVRTFDDLRRYRTPGHVIVAPHPFYPLTHSLHDALLQHGDLFDAIELSPFILPGFDVYNDRARRAATQLELPLVCNTDAHNLWQLGGSWTEIDTPALDVPSVLAAIRAGRVTPVCRRFSPPKIVWFFLCGALRWRLRELREWRARRQRPPRPIQ
jgi:predicted metal-dependent phosphoesterase TrpH